MHEAIFAQVVGRQDPNQAGPASGVGWHLDLQAAVRSMEGLPRSEEELPRAGDGVCDGTTRGSFALSWANLTRAVGRYAVATLCVLPAQVPLISPQGTIQPQNNSDTNYLCRMQVRWLPTSWAVFG